MKNRYIRIGVLVVIFAIVLLGCSNEDTTPCPTVEACPDAECPECTECPQFEACPETPECEVCPDPETHLIEVIPGEMQWAESPHNDVEAQAFVYFSEQDPAEVRVECARCHSTTGYMDYLGVDGSEPSVVNQPAPAGETIACIACHNQIAIELDSVIFPSGTVITDLGAEARCMVCHQGQASKMQVDEAIEANGLTEDVDTPKEELGFVNIHYYTAAASMYGTATMGGYEYDGKSYDFKNDHVEGYDTCIGCHDSHTLELKLAECAVCHTGVETVDDVLMIRMQGSEKDYNGNGDIEEGISEEINGLGELLYQAIQIYASEVSGAPIIYDSNVYPYYYIDTNENGEPDEEELNFGNRYNAWTARLLKAAYNLQTSMKDPGQYAHGGKYIIQLLYDSIEDLNNALSTPIDLSKATRIDAGHFAGSEGAFRHWDMDGAVEGQCAKCHSATGLPTYIHEALASESGVDGTNVAEDASNGLNCATCHDDLSTFTRYQVDKVKFPSKLIVSFGEAQDSNLCISCHQGRSSTYDLDMLIAKAGIGDDEISESVDASDANPHYFGAGASLFGTEVKGMYEYTGQAYAARNEHVPGFNTCLGCHETHSLELIGEKCGTCHNGMDNPREFRMSNPDYDGDGDIAEGIAGEIETMTETLFASIQAYAINSDEMDPIVYSSAYPYWFIDTNADGLADPDEINFVNQYVTWTPRLLRAAYNYQWVIKDPGAYSHNSTYIIQVLYDTILSIGGDVTGLVRPEL